MVIQGIGIPYTESYMSHEPPPLPSPTGPWAKPPAAPKTDGLLACPYCGHRFPLTWKRYFMAGLNKVRCPQCNEQCRFQVTLAYCGWWLVGFIAVIILDGAAVVMTWLILRRTPSPEEAIAAIICVAPALIGAGWYADKSITVRYKPLIKRKHGQ